MFVDTLTEKKIGKDVFSSYIPVITRITLMACREVTKTGALQQGEEM